MKWIVVPVKAARNEPAKLVLDPILHAIGECAPETDDVTGNPDDFVPVRIRQSECLGDKRVRHALRRGRSRPISRYPDRSARCRIDPCHPS